MALDPQLLSFVEQLKKMWPEPPLTLPVQVWRDRVETLSAASRPPYPEGLAVDDRMVDGFGPRPVKVRVYRPRSDRPLPALVYMHGGGWTIGSIDSHDSVTASLAADTPCVVISVDYARAPENPFPAAMEDCKSAVSWTFANASSLGINPEAIAVGGDSAGGNLSAAMTLAFRSGPERIRGQLLIYPAVDVDFSRPTFISEANAPYMTAQEMIWFWKQYCPTDESRKDPLAVPMRESDLKGLPRAFVVVAEHDTLRDEGKAYADRLKEAGVDVIYRPGTGLIHGFLRTRKFCDAAQAEHLAMTQWLRDLDK
jgi:acetyl esterase